MKRTKRITQNLLAIARQLPDEKYLYNSMAFRGSQLMERDKNHFRRMKRAFDSNGVEGVKKYVEPYIKKELRQLYFDKLQEVLC